MYELTSEDCKALDSLLGRGIIDTFQTPYGETFDVFDFDAFSTEFHE